MANLLSWIGGVANGIGGQINRTANQVQRNVVNPAVNFGVRNVQQAQRNVVQLPANVQRGAFDLQQQANNARKQAEEEARRIAEQRTREIMSIGNQAQQGFRQTSNMVTAPVRVLNKSSQGVKVDQSQVVQDLIPIARLAKTADLARQGKFMQAAQNTLRVPFASEAADVSRQMAANSADQYHAGPKIPGVNLPTRAEIEDNKMFARSVENAGNKTIGAVQNAPGVRKVLDGQLPGGFTLRQAGAFANDSIAKPTLMQANDMGEAIAGNNDQARLDKLGYTNDLKGASKLVYDTVSLASLGYSGTKAMQLVKAPTLGGALKLAPSVAARQFGSGVAQNTALQLSQGTPVQQLDPMQMALAGGTYALLGTGLPLTGKVAGKGLSKVGQAIDIQRAKPIMSAIETQKFADTMRKVTPQTAPDIPTKGKMVSQGYQDVSVDFKPKPVTNDFTGSILDNANYQLRNGQISEKQYKAFIVDDYTKRTGKLPTDDEVQGFINVAKEQPYAKLEQLRQQYSKPAADTAPQVGRAVGDVSAFDKTKRLEPGVKPGSVVDRMTNDKAYIDKINKVNAQQKNANGKTFGRSNNLYHTTSADNLDSIRQNGLTPGKAQRFEGVGSSDKLSFGANEKTAQYYGKQGDVMIRTKASYVPEDLQADLLAGGTGAYTSKSNIPASQLEVKVNGKWQPLVDSAKNKPIYELAPKPSRTPMKPGSDSFKTDTVENIIKDLKGVSQEFRDKVGSNINKNISVEDVPFSKLIRTKTPASKRLSSVEKLGSTDYVTVIKEGNRYRPVDGQHRIAVAENNGKSSLKMIVANSDSNMTTEQIKNQFGKAIAPEPKAGVKIDTAPQVGKTVYHGTRNTKLPVDDEFVSLTPDKAQARAFAEVRVLGKDTTKSVNVLPVDLPNGKTKKIDMLFGKELDSALRTAKKEGYDYVSYLEDGIKTNKKVETIVALNPKKLTPGPQTTKPINELAPKPPTKKVKMNEYGELQVKQRGFVTTVKNSPQTTPEVAKGVKGKYEPINNIDTLDTARKEVGLGKSGRVNNKKAYEDAIDTAKRSEDYSTETQAQSLILIEHLQSKGRTQDAIDIVEKMSERATKNGQASQILAAYNRLKPEGVLMMAQREIDKAKAMNPTKYANLKIEKVQATKLRKMATELQGLTGDERIVAQKEMLDEIGRLVPTPNMTKAVTLWKAGLLTGIKGGVSGNAVGNASNILVKKIADAPASAIDTVITQFTGNRSKVFTLKGWLSGFGEGLKAGKKQIQLGTGADDLASKLDYKKVYFSKNNPAGRFAQKYTDFVFGFYSASDKPWKMAALKNSLTDLATVEAKNKGLKGAAKAKFIKETVEAPPDNLLVQATNDSLDATFQDATALGGMLSGAKRSLAKHGPVAGAVGEVVAPFTGIPSSVATKMYRYSLVSSAVDIVRAIKASNKGQFDQAAQRKVSESIGKGLTGTALLGTGYALWNAGLMTTGMPQDPQERDLWELEGKQPWSVKVGGEWLSLNYTGPVLAILGAGATAAQSIKEGNTLPQTAFIAGMGTAKAVLESSPLRGVQGTLDVISDPARNGPRYLESLAGSTIPTISADVASSIDPLQREAMSPLDAMTNRVPIWRYGLNPKLNPFGEPKANQAFGVQAIVDPFRMSEDRTSSLTTELRNLYNTNKDLGTMPSDFKKDFYGGDTKLNEKQIYDLTVKIKPEIKEAWEKIIVDPRYQNLSPEQRKKVLDKAAEDIRAARKFETGVQGGFLNEAEARKKLETGAKRILRGGQTDYINKETGGEDTPKQKYETALNDYEDKKKNGEISSIDEIKTQKALKKLQAQSNFDQDTVDLYGLSLKEIDGYLKSQPNGGDIYQKLLALDDAMEASGSTRKFKNRKLVVSSGKKSTKGKKAKKGGKAKKGTAIKIPSIKGSTYKTPKFVTRKIASRKLSTKALPKIKAGKVYV